MTEKSIGVDDAFCISTMDIMDTQRTTQRFAELFPEVYRRFHRRIHHAEYQMTSESLAVVQHLADSGPLTVTEAARHMDRSQAAMSELISRLVDRGLLDRMPDERDKRRILIWLTPQGWDALKQARQILSPELLERAISQLSDDQRETLINSVETLLNTSPFKEKPNHE